MGQESTVSESTNFHAQGQPVYVAVAQPPAVAVPAEATPLESSPLINDLELPALNQTNLLLGYEILGKNDPQCLSGLLRGFNFLYRIGFFFTYYLLLFVFLIIAPFLGMAQGIVTIVLQVVRGFARPVGHLVADTLGYGALVNKATAKLDPEKMV